MNTHNTCLFCRIVSQEIPANIITQNHNGIVIKDINPRADIHWLVLPRTHFNDLRNITEQDSDMIGSLIMLGTTAIQKYAHNVAFRLVINNGAKVGQHIFHCHIHLLGDVIHDNHVNL